MTFTNNKYSVFVFSSGNAGTAGTSRLANGLQCSLIKHESGNKGTQLCLIKSLAPSSVPAQKIQGTSTSPESTDLEPLHPRSRVPADFEFSRVNKVGVSCFQ